MRDLESIIAKVIAKYDSQELYNIIQEACIYNEESIDSNRKLIDIDIEYLEDNTDCANCNFYNRTIDYNSDETELEKGIKYLIALYNGCQPKNTNKNIVTFEFHPKDEQVFKFLFMLVGKAYRFLYFKDNEEPITSVWKMRNFSMNSNLKANIFSAPYYRNNRLKGLYKIKIEVPFCEKYEDYTFAQVIQEKEEIKKHIFAEKIRYWGIENF